MCVYIRDNICIAVYMHMCSCVCDYADEYVNMNIYEELCRYISYIWLHMCM